MARKSGVPEPDKAVLTIDVCVPGLFTYEGSKKCFNKFHL